MFHEILENSKKISRKYENINAHSLSVAEPLAAPASALDGRGPGADSGSGSDLLGSAPAPGSDLQKNQLRLQSRPKSGGSGSATLSQPS